MRAIKTLDDYFGSKPKRLSEMEVDEALKELLVGQNNVSVSEDRLVDQIQYIQGRYRDFTNTLWRLHPDPETWKKSYRIAHWRTLPDVATKAQTSGYDGGLIILDILDARFRALVKMFASAGSLSEDRFREIMSAFSHPPDYKGRIHLNDTGLDLWEQIWDNARHLKAQKTIQDLKKRLDMQVDILHEAGSRIGYGGNEFKRGYMRPGIQYVKPYLKPVEEAIKPSKA